MRDSVGEWIRIYLNPDDPDSEHHGRVCIVTDVFSDNLAAETDRDIDSSAKYPSTLSILSQKRGNRCSIARFPFRLTVARSDPVLSQAH